jgi:hypothetical protein
LWYRSEGERVRGRSLRPSGLGPCSPTDLLLGTSLPHLTSAPTAPRAYLCRPIRHISQFNYQVTQAPTGYSRDTLRDPANCTCEVASGRLGCEGLSEPDQGFAVGRVRQRARPGTPIAPHTHLNRPHTAFTNTTWYAAWCADIAVELALTLPPADRCQGQNASAPGGAPPGGDQNKDKVSQKWW